MHPISTVVAALVLIGGLTPCAHAQSQSGAQTTSSSSFAAGQAQGDTTAAHTAAFSWFGRGVVAGTLAGPLGSWLVVSKAGQSGVSIPQGQRDAISQREPEYVSGFEEGFQRRLRSERREYAFVGSVLGTAAFAFAILRLTHFVGRASQTGGDTPGSGF
jgi:hypothetical protein